MAITQTINLNMIPDSAPVVVRCDQYDTGTGRIIAKLYNGATEYTPGAGATAVIQGTKPDNTAFSYAATISGNTVTADLTQQMSAVYGAVRCQFVVTETSGRTGTFVFILRVQQSALEDTADISETEIPAIIDAAEHNAERAEEAVEHYPYIDNTTKHWFVWDVENEEWHDTGVNAYGSVTQGNGIKIINGVISVDADSTPTQNSTKPVTSGGAYTALSAKADNSVIAPVEDGDKYSTTYSAGKRFIRGGKLCRTTVGVTSADTPTLNTNYVEEPDVATALEGYVKYRGVINSSYNLDNITDFGVYTITTMPTNAPSDGAYSSLRVLPLSSGTAILQEITKNYKVWRRAYTGSPAAWTNWYVFSGTEIVP